ncbi:hypothetical protein D1BOALGB6SA_3019 [Olavius sp. associated proteobacterium Delta 1]|nr:hypothetical protein D1BOALGB6SA_3019 [Olavius sp. associated proteobacterium Delta 1]
MYFLLGSYLCIQAIAIFIEHKMHASVAKRGFYIEIAVFLLAFGIRRTNGHDISFAKTYSIIQHLNHPHFY